MLKPYNWVKYDKNVVLHWENRVPSHTSTILRKDLTFKGFKVFFSRNFDIGFAKIVLSTSTEMKLVQTFKINQDRFTSTCQQSFGVFEIVSAETF